MAWKVEKWLREVFPGREKIYSEYRSLSARELAIVSAAVLDLALAELITRRLNDFPSESEGFLGLDGDGRAPAASFGARIQLGLLIGLLTREDAEVLRALKEVRNQFAHRVRVGFLSPSVQKALKKLYTAWLKRMKNLVVANTPESEFSGYRQLGRYLAKVPQAGEGLLLAVFSIYQAYFHQMHGRIVRVEEAVALEASETGGKPSVN